MRQPKIRSVGPAFFQDDDVLEVSIAARLLLLGISNLADDQGVFRWKPMSLKAHVFPADNVDVKALLGELEAADLIRRFEAEDSTFGAVRGWGRHQKPKDARGTHPLPVELDAFVRIDEVPPPRERKDRPAPPWPLRPKGSSPDCPPAVHPPSGGQPGDVHPPSTGCPPAVPPPSTVEGRGVEGSGGEGSGDPPTPREGEAASPRGSASPPDEPAGRSGWPGNPEPHLVEAAHTAMLGPLQEFASTKQFVSRAKPRDLQRALIQAVVQCHPAPPNAETLIHQFVGSDSMRDRIRGQVKAWLAQLDADAAKAKSLPSFLAKALRYGPRPQRWQMPGFGQVPAERAGGAA